MLKKMFFTIALIGSLSLYNSLADAQVTSLEKIVLTHHELTINLPDEDFLISRELDCSEIDKLYLVFQNDNKEEVNLSYQVGNVQSSRRNTEEVFIGQKEHIIVKPLSKEFILLEDFTDNFLSNQIKVILQGDIIPSNTGCENKEISRIVSYFPILCVILFLLFVFSCEIYNIFEKFIDKYKLKTFNIPQDGFYDFRIIELENNPWCKFILKNDNTEKVIVQYTIISKEGETLVQTECTIEAKKSIKITQYIGKRKSIKVELRPVHVETEE